MLPTTITTATAATAIIAIICQDREYINKQLNDDIYVHITVPLLMKY